MGKKKKCDKKEWIVRVGFIGVMAILLWRCFYSVNYGDEPYCISSVWRFYKGDALLAEDWFPAQQLIAWILSPLFYLFRLFSDSNDGVILASRIGYVLFQGVISIVLYVRLKEYKAYRIPAVLFYLLFTQNNMFTLNYNTLGIGCMILILALLITETTYSKVTLMVVGILSAIMILSQPYAIIMFFAWGFAVMVALLFSGKIEIPSLLKFRTFFWVGMGAFLVLLVFVAVVLSRAEIAEVQNGFRYLMSDPEHQMDWKYKFTKYFERFYRYYKYQIVMTGACMVVGFLKNHRVVQFMKMECFLLSAAAAINTLIQLGWVSDYVPIDFVCVPMTFLGCSIWLLGEKKNKKLFFGWMIPALLYTFCVQLTTNTGILAVSSACIVASAGGVLLIGDSFEGTKKVLSRGACQSVMIIFAAVMVLQGTLLLYHRITATWWSEPISECTVLLEKGPAKGIYTVEEDAEEYYAALEVVDSFRLTKEDTVLFLELEPMMYLYADVPAGAYSTWTIEEENFLEEYYEAYPEKQPTVICWTDAELEEDAVEMQFFLDKGYERIDTNGAIALRRK